MSNRLFCLCVRSLIASLTLLLPAAAARATVTLALSDNDATPTSAQVGPGGTVVLSVRLTATSEQTTGLDYFLRAAAPGSGLFTLTDRSLVGSSYPTPFFIDGDVEAASAALLNPDNDVDLGGTVANVNAPLGPGTRFVANLTLAVSPSAPPGAYTIQTFSQPGTGWIGAGVGDPPEFPETVFDNHGTFTIQVPEPGGVGLLALAGAALIRRRFTRSPA